MSIGEKQAIEEELDVEKTAVATSEASTSSTPGAAQTPSQSIPLPPRAREELKSLIRLQNEAQERVRLVLTTLEEALEVPIGWVIRDVDEGFVEVQAPPSSP